MTSPNRPGIATASRSNTATPILSIRAPAGAGRDDRSVFSWRDKGVRTLMVSGANAMEIHRRFENANYSHSQINLVFVACKRNLGKKLRWRRFGFMPRGPVGLV